MYVKKPKIKKNMFDNLKNWEDPNELTKDNRGISGISYKDK